MASLFRPAVTLFLVLTAVTGIVYPLAVTGLAHTFFPQQAAGSLIQRGDQLLGSRLIGQSFTQPKYFWSRPSATAPMPYNAAGSSGSNMGPLNPALSEAVKARVAALHQADPDNRLPVPVDLVTASASGLDPHISVAAAMYQVDRVARVRKLSRDAVIEKVNAHTQPALWGILGEARVNVLELNLDLDGGV